MIADDGSPVLMDFGSTVKARIKVESRSQALLQQVRCFVSVFAQSRLTSYLRILLLNRARWRIEHQNCSMSKLVSPSTRKSIYGYVVMLYAD